MRPECTGRITAEPLSVYLRLNEVPVASIYGPTADERQRLGGR